MTQNKPIYRAQHQRSRGSQGWSAIGADVVGTNPNPGEALPPGQGFKGLKDGSTINTVFGPVTVTGGNRPERYGSFIEQVLPNLGIPVGDLDKLPTGLGVKAARLRAVADNRSGPRALPVM